eukprot:SAG11_NODE_1826_length_4202_cov_24.651231_3_plen_106_part_00
MHTLVRHKFVYSGANCVFWSSRFTKDKGAIFGPPSAKTYDGKGYQGIKDIGYAEASSSNLGGSNPPTPNYPKNHVKKKNTANIWILLYPGTKFSILNLHRAHNST